MSARSSSRTSTATPKPLSAGARYAQSEQQSRSARTIAVFVALGIVVFFLAPSPVGPFPNPLAAVPGQPDLFGPWDWRGTVLRGLLPTLTQPVPPPELDLPLPSVPLWRVGTWVLAGLGGLFILTLIAHVASLYRQRTRPLQAKHTYLRIKVPGDQDFAPTDGATLLRTLHGMVPAAAAPQGNPVPLTLRWSGRPEQPVVQGLTLCGPPTLVVSVQKTLEGLARGSTADQDPDPLLDELKDGRWLCWADVRQAGPATLPIAVADRGEDPLLDAMIPALATQGGVYLTDVQVLLAPLADRSWRLPVLALQEQLKIDLSTAEKRALEAKASGPAYRVGMRLRVVADSREAGMAMVQTMAATLSSTAMAVAGMSQRLMATAPQALPAALPPPPPFPRQLLKGAAVVGVVMGLATAIGVVSTSSPWLLLAIAPLISLVPALAVGCWYRKRSLADLRLLHAGVTGAILPPVNPQVVPFISGMLGHNND